MFSEKNFESFFFETFARGTHYTLSFHSIPQPIGTPGTVSATVQGCRFLFSSLFFSVCYLSFMQGLCSMLSISSAYYDTLTFIYSPFCIIFMYNLYARKAYETQKTAAIVGVSTFIAVSQLFR